MFQLIDCVQDQVLIAHSYLDQNDLSCLFQYRITFLAPHQTFNYNKVELDSNGVNKKHMYAKMFSNFRKHSQKLVVG